MNYNTVSPHDHNTHTSYLYHQIYLKHAYIVQLQPTSTNMYVKSMEGFLLFTFLGNNQISNFE